MTWPTIDEEYPKQCCRRCDVAYYADDDAEDEDRVNVQAPSGVVHIQRPADFTKGFSAGVLIMMQGDKATYCGLRIARFGRD